MLFHLGCIGALRSTVLLSSNECPWYGLGNGRVVIDGLWVIIPFPGLYVGLISSYTSSLSSGTCTSGTLPLFLFNEKSFVYNSHVYSKNIYIVKHYVEKRKNH